MEGVQNLRNHPSGVLRNTIDVQDFWWGEKLYLLTRVGGPGQEIRYEPWMIAGAAWKDARRDLTRLVIQLRAQPIMSRVPQRDVISHYKWILITHLHSNKVLRRDRNYIAH